MYNLWGGSGEWVSFCRLQRCSSRPVGGDFLYEWIIAHSFKWFVQNTFRNETRLHMKSHTSLQCYNILCRKLAFLVNRKAWQGPTFTPPLAKINPELPNPIMVAFMCVKLVNTIFPTAISHFLFFMSFPPSRSLRCT